MTTPLRTTLSGVVLALLTADAAVAASPARRPAVTYDAPPRSRGARALVPRSRADKTPIGWSVAKAAGYSSGRRAIGEVWVKH